MTQGETGPGLRSGKDHDYTSQGWGHAIGVMGDDGRWLGHGPRSGARMVEGDAIVVAMRSGRRGRYVIDAIDYYRDPPDMWRATVRLAGYVDEARAADAQETDR